MLPWLAIAGGGALLALFAGWRKQEIVREQASATGASVGAQSPTVSSHSTQGSVAQGFGFVPFSYTNRPTGPLVGSVTQSNAPIQQTQTYKDLGLAKMAANAALTVTRASIQAAQALGAAIASSVSSVLTGVGAVIGVGFGAAQLAEGKGRDARDRAVQQIGTSIVGLIPGVGLAAIPMAIESMNDAKLLKQRIPKNIQEYKDAVAAIQTKLPFIVRPSDRLDEMRLLPRVSHGQQVAWLQDSVRTTQETLTKFTEGGGNNLSKAVTEIKNGNDLLGIPGRNVSELETLVERGVRDSFILYFACRDMLQRMRESTPGSAWPSIPGGKDQILRNLAGMVGYNPLQDFGPSKAGSGVIPGWGVPGYDPQGGRWDRVIAPALDQVLTLVERPGWSLWALVQYFALADHSRFIGSPFYARMAQSGALEIVFTITPHQDSDVPALPDAVTVQASLDQTRASVTAIAQQLQAEEQARIDAPGLQTGWIGSQVTSAP